MSLKIQLTQTKGFVESKKKLATYFLENFKFKGDTLAMLEDIQKKGYTLKGDGVLKSIFPYGERKKDLSFANL